MSVAVDRVLAALRSHGCAPRPSGVAWAFRCPLREQHRHSDRRPSGWLTVNGDGKACATCQACGSDADAQLLAAIGLSFADLYADAGSTRRVGDTKRMRAKLQGRTRPGASAIANRKAPPAYATLRGAIDAAARAAKGRAGHVWTYHDADGAEAMHVLRVELPDGDKTFRPIRRDPDGYRLGDPDGPLPLYALPDLRAADPAVPVNVHEGEKAADADRALRRVATSSAHGARSAHRTDWTPLAGRTVHIHPDNDSRGRKYANDVAAILTALEPPCRVKLVTPPDLPERGDVADLIADRRADGKDDAAIRRELDDLADAAPEWTPPAAPLQPAPPATEATTEQAAPFSDGEQSRDWLKATGGIWRDQVEAGIVEVSDRILGWFERRGPETLTKPDGDLPRESVSYAASIVGIGSRQRMYQLRDWARTRRLASTTVVTADCQPAVDTLTERTLRPVAKLLAAGRPEDVPEVVSRAYERFRERQEDARTRAATSRYPVRIPKAPSSYDVRAAVDEVLPPTPGKSHAARPAVQTTPDAGELAELSEAAKVRRRIADLRTDAAGCPDLPRQLADVLTLAELVAGMTGVPDDVRRAIREADRLARQRWLSA